MELEAWWGLSVCQRFSPLQPQKRRYTERRLYHWMLLENANEVIYFKFHSASSGIFKNRLCEHELPH